MDITETAELIAMIRDIAFLVLILVVILVVLALFFKVMGLINSVKRTTKEAEEIITTVADKVVGRAVAGSGVAFGAGKAAAFLFGLKGKRKKKKGKGEDEDG